MCIRDRDTIRNIGEKMGAKGGDLVLMIADKPATVARALGELRLEMARRMNMIDQDKLAFTWVTDFPMFEYNEDEKRYVAMHHPFTMPRHAALDKLESDPGSVKAIAYDMVSVSYTHLDVYKRQALYLLILPIEFIPM